MLTLADVMAGGDGLLLNSRDHFVHVRDDVSICELAAKLLMVISHLTTMSSVLVERIPSLTFEVG